MENIKSCDQILDLFLEFAEDFQILNTRYDIPEELVDVSRKTSVCILLAHYAAYHNELEFSDITKLTIPACFYAGMASIVLWNDRGSDILIPNLYTHLTAHNDITELNRYAKALCSIEPGSMLDGRFDRAIDQLVPIILNECCESAARFGGDVMKRQIEEFLCAVFQLGLYIGCDCLANLRAALSPTSFLTAELKNDELISTNFWDNSCRKIYCAYGDGIIHMLIPEGMENCLSEMETSEFCSFEFDDKAYVVVFDDRSDSPFCMMSEIGAINALPDLYIGGLRVYTKGCKLRLTRMCKFVDKRE